MPDIKEEELLSLHYQIEKAETKQKKLEDLLEVKSKRLKENGSFRKNLLLTCLVLVLCVISLSIYLLLPSKKPVVESTFDTEELLMIQVEMDSLRNQLDNIRKEKISLNEVKDLYLYRNLINKEKVFSVQVMSFTKNKTALVSQKFMNTRFYNDSLYFKFSLGIFETLSEAQDFRKILIQSGFNEKIFVISYKDGKRVRIENAE